MKIGIFSLAYSPFVGGAELAVKEITDRLGSYNSNDANQYSNATNSDNLSSDGRVRTAPRTELRSGSGVAEAPQSGTKARNSYAFVCFTHRFDRAWPENERVGNVFVNRIENWSLKIENYQDGYYGHFWQKIGYVWRAWRAAEKEHKTAPFDAIWAIMAAYGGLATLLFKLRHPRVPMLLTLQEGDSEKHILRRVGIFYPFWRLIFKRADFVQAISHYLADLARRHGAKCPIEVVPNGVDLAKYQNPKLKIQNNYQLPVTNYKTIITTSRLVYKNGIDVLIRALAVIAIPPGREKQSREIAASPPPPRNDIKLRILGSGPDEMKLKNLTEELGMVGNVEFLGHVEPDKIPEHLAKADIFVRPSRSEGLGSSFLEAMAAGLPIIGTPVGGIPDFLVAYNTDRRINADNADMRIKNENRLDVDNMDRKINADNADMRIRNENGLYVEVDNLVDLADKIRFLIKHPHIARRLGENGRKLVEVRYNWDIIAQKLKVIFNKLT